MDSEGLILRLFDVNAVKFGSFTLKSGIQSPVYFDLRVMVSYPDIMDAVAETLFETARKSGVKYSVLCGVPYTALPIATLMAVKQKVPMVIRRKEAKSYGTKKMIEGVFEQGDVCLIVEDVVTSGSSVMETSQSLAEVGLKVTDAIVLLDRAQGGAARLRDSGINLYSAFDLPRVLEVLHSHGKISAEVVQSVKLFIQENMITSLPQQPAAKKPRREYLGYKARTELCEHPVAKQLFSIMEDKQTNLAFSVDVTTSSQVLELADQVGPYICVLKTHVDILEDFSATFIQSLQDLAQKHNFLIFEDRKFADIGNTVQHQYSSGVYRISEWSHITNAHSVAGPGTISGLKAVGGAKNRACLLIGQMSSSGNLAMGDYTQATVKMAEENSDFVIGFISTSSLTPDPKFIHMTPGVKLVEGKDNLGQRYLTPSEVITNRKSDIIIVGRGIYQASNPGEVAKQYKEAGMKAYHQLLEGETDR
ncbi:uridine 5'-monophosphate synthase [Strongylocentrotus purpuratus]|uniref:Uridine 5'-monophosphate synthase n=1 Tax=Strongylocentrotus purpuratus TaxID=7668 RepID=A0A7M7T0U5_STRPU|nr:uridine 5'-monophosphate synthase [Strongylocentrotus purpuratus]